MTKLRAGILTDDILLFSEDHSATYQWVQGINEADHSVPSSAEWSYTSSPPVCLHGLFGITDTWIRLSAQREMQPQWGLQLKSNKPHVTCLHQQPHGPPRKAKHSSAQASVESLWLHYRLCRLYRNNSESCVPTVLQVHSIKVIISSVLTLWSSKLQRTSTYVLRTMLTTDSKYINGDAVRILWSGLATFISLKG